MPEHYKPFTSSLRARLLLLTIVFVMVISVFVYLPSIATFRQDYLEKRMENAQIAALALEEAPNNAVSPKLEAELLETAGVIAIIMRREDKSLFLGYDAMPEDYDLIVDMRNPSLGLLIKGAFSTMRARGNRIVRVVGDPMVPGTRWLEVIMNERPLYEALTRYSNNVLMLAIITSLFTGILVYMALHWLMVRPMRRLKDNIAAFRQKPEAVPAKGKRLTSRGDEIGLVERELLRMQDELRQNLRQKNNLASLGEAVAKINHDLRNILATAQLASDAINQVDHPRVQQSSRRLVSAVSRAISLCESTMKHGKAEEALPEKKLLRLKELVQDVGTSLGITDNRDFRFELDFADDLEVFADPEQLHRVFLNLCRNAKDVQGQSGLIKVSANVAPDDTVLIHVQDNGPGIPEQVLPTLFKAFSVSRSGGMGLGLATARDIMLAHGGQIMLERTGPDGTVFMLCLPGDEE